METLGGGGEGMDASGWHVPWLQVTCPVGEISLCGAVVLGHAFLNGT